VPPWARTVEGGLALTIRLTPKSSRDAIEGAETASDGSVHLKARVRAAPESGKANAALEALVAKEAGVPKSAVRVTAGHTSRLKTVQIVCATTEGAALIARLATG